MNIVAKEYFYNCKILPFFSSKHNWATAFGDYQVEFHLVDKQVIRETKGGRVAIAQIHPDCKGSKLRNFLGTVESESFIVTKRKKDWLSEFTGNVIFEITLKDSGITHTNMLTRYDLFNSFKVKGVFELKLTNTDQVGSPYQIEGTHEKDFQDLTEVIACLVLHYNESQD